MRARLSCLALLALVAVLVPTQAAADPLGCEPGEFCLWPSQNYRGPITQVSLADTNPGECVPVPTSRSFTNLMTRDLTVYQSADCSTEADFTTYPGGGTYVPNAPFVVRAVQIWSP